MYIKAKNKKTVYQLYLKHSKKIEQYLCSIEKEELKHMEDEEKNETTNWILENYMKKVISNAYKVSENIRNELNGDFNKSKILSLFSHKIRELEAIENNSEV
ncbi:hypothetical protein IZY60_04440 [Lutibacter sp. B2]|nr:hypothetical protein [Lutibacter sp. B2]